MPSAITIQSLQKKKRMIMQDIDQNTAQKLVTFLLAHNSLFYQKLEMTYYKMKEILVNYILKSYN